MGLSWGFSCPLCQSPWAQKINIHSHNACIWTLLDVHTDCAPKFDGRLFFRESSAHTLIKRFVSFLHHNQLFVYAKLERCAKAQRQPNWPDIQNNISPLLLILSAQQLCDRVVVGRLHNQIHFRPILSIRRVDAREGDVDDEKKYRFLINIGRKLLLATLAIT